MAEERRGGQGRAVGPTSKMLVAFGAALGAWQIMSAADPARAAVQVLMAAGAAVLVAALLFARELIEMLRGPLYVMLLVVLGIWLVLAWGSTQWQWSLLPG